MGLYREFKDFLELKKGKSFLSNELYIAELGTILVSEIYATDTKHANFIFDKYVIVQRATSKEVEKHLKAKFGTFMGHVDYIDSVFERPEHTTYYKLITMNNRIIASATPNTIIHQADPGTYEIIHRARTLNGVRKNPNIRLADTIDFDTVKEIEEIINHQVDFSIR